MHEYAYRTTLYLCIYRVKTLRNNYKLKKRKEAELIRQGTISSSASTTTHGTSKKANKRAAKMTKTSTTTTATAGAADNLSVEASTLPSLASHTEDDATIMSTLIQDQGYVRPRILILCPFRSSVRKIVKQIISKLGPNTTVSSWEKFNEEYGNNYDQDDEDGDATGGGSEDGDNNDNKTNNTSISLQKRYSKPIDYQNVFYDNVDDDFKLGLQLNPGQGKSSSSSERGGERGGERGSGANVRGGVRSGGGSGGVNGADKGSSNGSEKGTYLRLYTDFYQSDIIIASPIGLKYIIENNETTTLNYDYLSSLEIIYLYHCDVMCLQNWDHVNYILNLCNQLPKHVCKDTDFIRIRPYYLTHTHAYQHRQLIMTSVYNEPCIQATYRMYSNSIIGNLRIKQIYHTGCITQIKLNIKQIFQKIPCTSYITYNNDKFNYFINNILLQIIRYDQKRTLIIAPSYFDYIRIRNELMRREVR